MIKVLRWEVADIDDRTGSIFIEPGTWSFRCLSSGSHYICLSYVSSNYFVFCEL